MALVIDGFEPDRSEPVLPLVWLTCADLQDCAGIPVEAAGVDVGIDIARGGPIFLPRGLRDLNRWF